VAPGKTTDKGTSGVALDAADRRLLNLLQADASLTNHALAAKAHLSPATCLRRVRRLVELGVIERQVAIVSPEAVGAGLTACVEVTLDHQGAEHQQAFERRAAAEPAVQQCYRVSPGPDFVLLVRVAEIPAYQQLVQRLFTSAGNVRNVRGFFAIRRSKFEPSVVL
jgi:DNA-binding Lrp family transcriptional regulator